MKKCIFIIPYFGKFNNYFSFFLESCAKNPDFDWLIFTDDRREFPYPNNVHVKYCCFSDIVDLIHRKIDSHAKVEKPYKLCDYKPTYGYLFENYVKDYFMWGYCDLDLIWGDISKWITEDILNRYDKIGVSGHCTLIRNTQEHNRLFFKNLENDTPYKKVFSSNESKHFDEEHRGGINNIFEYYGYKIYTNLKPADLYVKSSDFLCCHYVGDNKYNVEKKNPGVFVWDNGVLNRYYINQNKLVIDEYMYIHLQKRKMKICISDICKLYKIIPNSFENVEAYPITLENYKQIRIKYWNWQFISIRYRFFLEKVTRWAKFSRKFILGKE